MLWLTNTQIASFATTVTTAYQHNAVSHTMLRCPAVQVAALLFKAALYRQAASESANFQGRPACPALSQKD